MLPSVENLNHQLASSDDPVASPALAKENTELALRLAAVITFHSAFSSSYLNPNCSYTSILSCRSVFSAVSNTVANLGNTALSTAPAGMMSFKVIGPMPDSRFPAPSLDPSPTTAETLAHALSSARSVPDVTNRPFKNSRVSGEVNLIRAPGCAYFKLLVAKSPTASGPPAAK